MSVILLMFAMFSVWVYFKMSLSYYMVLGHSVKRDLALDAKDSNSAITLVYVLQYI